MLIPAHHRKMIVNTFGCQNLMKVDDTIVEGSGAGGQIKIPHAQETVVKHLSGFFDMLLVIFLPA